MLEIELAISTPKVCSVFVHTTHLWCSVTTTLRSAYLEDILWRLVLAVVPGHPCSLAGE